MLYKVDWTTFGKPLGVGTNAGTNAGTTLTTTLVAFASVTATSINKPVSVRASGLIYNGNSGANRSYDIHIYCDGVSVGNVGSITLANVSGTANGHWFNFVVKHTPSAGSHTWDVRLLASANSAVAVSSNAIEVTQHIA